MIKLIKGAGVYTPEYKGEKDILIIGDKIAEIGQEIDFGQNCPVSVEIIDGNSKIAVPGFIDSHAHILGGGGEGGYATRTPEIILSDITTAGVTTIVGCLGTDGISRSMIALLSKARGLEEEGVTTFIYTGSYRVPVTTITGDLMKDFMAVDKVIGVGEIAIADHRSSQPELFEIKKLAADARVGGILSGKAGVVNLHVGDGRDMINMLFDICENTEIPYSQFIPTHMNRNPYLFEEAIRFASKGGYVDFTTSSDPVFWEEGEVKASRALKKCLDMGIPSSHVTFSSDGQGSLPVFNEKKEFVGLRVGRVSTLYSEVKDAVLEDGIPLEEAIKVITTSPAGILKLKCKGRIEKGYDADVVLLDKTSLEVDTVLARGKTMVQDGKAVVFGTFER